MLYTRRFSWLWRYILWYSELGNSVAWHVLRIRGTCRINFRVIYGVVILWRICSNQELWRQRTSRCQVMTRIHTATKRITYALMSRNNRRGVASGVPGKKPVWFPCCLLHIGFLFGLYLTMKTKATWSVDTSVNVHWTTRCLTFPKHRCENLKFHISPVSYNSNNFRINLWSIASSS
jgi:hypothetical protein